MIFLDKTDILENKHVTVSLCATKIVYGLTRVRTRASDMRDWKLRVRDKHGLRK